MQVFFFQYLAVSFLWTLALWNRHAGQSVPLAWPTIDVIPRGIPKKNYIKTFSKSLRALSN